MNEPDKKVREAAHQSFSIFIKKAKRRIGPHLKKIFSLWYCSFFDVSAEVQSIAKKNFEIAFPENKRDQVFKIAYKNFLHFANEQLKQSEDQLNESTIDLSKGQREDVFDRITSSVLLSLASSFQFIKDWPEEEQEHFKKKLISILDLSVSIPSQKQGGQEEKKQKVQQKQKETQSYLWGFLQSKYRGRVRSSCLSFISNLLLNLPKEVIEYHITQLSPLIYGLIGEDNSSLQTTLWRDAIFTLGKNFPQSWETVQIKKNFLPKFNNTLKNAGYGAPTALYENFVKFASIFPFYHIVDYVEDKNNKASFKERCNLIRESLTTLYQGLKMDESVAFHQDLIRSYYETFTFLVWKRIQPLIVKETATQEDKQFALDQLKKCIQVPVEDYINNFEKFQSRVQNQRNIRVMIPTQMAKMFHDFAERTVNEEIFQSLIANTWESIALSLEKKNTVRLLNGFLKCQFDQNQSYFQKQILENLVIKYMNTLIEQIEQDINNLSKENIDKISQKLQNIQRITYKLNKFQTNLTQSTINIDRQITILRTVQKKEDLAKNVLSQDILKKFGAIKETLLKVIILTINNQGYPKITEFLNDVFETLTLDIKVRNSVLLPQQEFKKVNFKNYFSEINQFASDRVLSFILKNAIGEDKNISENSKMIDQGIVLLESNKPTFLQQKDLIVISEAVLEKIKHIRSDISSLAYYFSSLKAILVKSDQTTYDNLKHLLFEKLLTVRATHSSYQTLWSMFEQIIKTHIDKDLKQDVKSDFFNHCLLKLKSELHNIIHQNSNYDVETFNRFTVIVKAFVQLCKDKQQIIEDILLQEDNFTNLENNSLPLKMFKDLFLSGGVGFDVTKLFSVGSKYVWLASILLNTRHLSSLANFIQLKKQYLIFVDTEVLPALIHQAQNGNEKLILDIFNFLSQKSSSNVDYIYTLEYFLKKMIDPGEDFPADEKPILKVDEFKQVFKYVSEGIFEKFLKDQKIEYNLDVLKFLKSLKHLAYYIVDEKSTEELFQKSTSILINFKECQRKDFNEQFGFALDTYQCLLEFYKSEESEKVSQEILIYMLQNSTEISKDVNILNAFLQYVAYSMNSFGVSKFNKLVSEKLDFQSFISQMIEVQIHHHIQPITYIYLLTIIRKTIGGDLIKDKQLLINQVIEIAKDHALSFDIKIQRIKDNLARESQGQEIHVKEEDKSEDSEDEEDDQIENFEYEMLQELAETLLVFGPYIAANINENDLYILIGSGVESLQKASFVLLKYLYETFIPQIKFYFDDSDVIGQLKSEQEENEKQEQIQQNQSEEEKKHQEATAHQRYKNKLAFKNISEILIELLDSPPNVTSQEQQDQQIVSGYTQVESIIFGDSQEGCMNNKVFGYFLAWNALLIKIENGRIKSQLQSNSDYLTVLGALNEYLEENYEVYQMLLVSLIAYLPEYKRGLQDAFNVSSFEPEYIVLQDQKSSVLFAVYTLINFMKSFPSLARKYYQECEKQLLDIVMPYIKQIVSPAILDNEIKKIEVAQSLIGSQELTFALFKSTKEIMASYTKGEIEMTLKIKIPSDYPLKLVEVDVSKQIKISEKQMRKWILAIRKILQFQNGDIISAVLLWKNNIEKEIEGVEDCYICYCVVHEQDQSLPKMPCKTCKNKFHVACIRKWFRTSHKSNCPICQNYFF